MSYSVRQGVHVQEALGGIGSLLSLPGRILGKVGTKTIGNPGVNSALGKAKSAASGIVCGVVQRPGFAQGAAMASGGVGVLAVAGASGICGPGMAPMPMFPPQDDMMMPILLGVGALALVLVLSKPKKKAVVAP